MYFTLQSGMPGILNSGHNCSANIGRYAKCLSFEYLKKVYVELRDTSTAKSRSLSEFFLCIIAAGLVDAAVTHKYGDVRRKEGNQKCQCCFKYQREKKNHTKIP